MSVVILNEQNFSQEVEDFPGATLVDFWAPWCGPCRTQGPIVEELAQDLAAHDKIKVAKLNVDENPSISQRFNVRSIPTLVFFKNGKPDGQFVGVNQKNILKDKLEELASI